MYTASRKLWLCLRFHQLPLQALVRDKANQPATAVLEKQRVLLTDDHAAELGIRPGQSTSTVRALADTIQLLERDPAAEQRCLQQLCCWAYSISPTLYAYRADSLLLEVGSCLLLHGGLDALLARIRLDLSCRGYHYCSGLAATPMAAWLFSYQESGEDPLHNNLEQRLAPLPLNLLSDFPRQVDALAKAGLWCFGDILTLPPQALARRCGREFALQLKRVLGTAEDPHPDFQPPTRFSDDYWFGYEVKANQELHPAIQQLLQSFCLFLRHTQLQAQEIQWLLSGINRSVETLQVRCSAPHSDWRQWYQLTELKLEQLQLTTSIEGIELRCEQLRAGQAESRDLFDQASREPLHSLLDRLQNRLGLQSIKKIACRDEHLPEFAGYSSNDQPLNPAANSGGTSQRPFWLMPEPQPLRHTRKQLYWNGQLTLLEGPERIEDNWWLDAVSRDYYVARDPHGQHYWIFRDRLQDHWYIQGIFA